MKQITVKAYAKINLFLEVKERLPNGYHDLESIMQSVSLCDVLHFEINDSNTFTLDCPKIDCDYKSNLIYKAAMEFFRVSGIQFTGLDVKVEKNIPSWQLYMITSDEQFERHFGRRCDKKRVLYNGMIKCNLYQYFKPRKV